MNVNRFHSNNGASTGSNQMTMNQTIPQFAANGEGHSTTPTTQQMQTVIPMQVQGSQWMGQQPNQAPMTMPTIGFNMQLPAQIIQDAIALSKPVTSDDDPLLCEHIIQGLKRGESYKVVLNGLHGRNGHSASLWKDYYLEHKQRLDNWVNMVLRNTEASPLTPAETHFNPTPHASQPSSSRSEKPVSISKAVTMKKPSLADFTTQRHEASASHEPSDTPSMPHKKEKIKIKEGRKPTAREEIVQATGSRRATLNSITVGSPVFDKRLPPPHAEIKIPEPPSRSPSPPPPGSLVLKGKGYKYTDEDDNYFVKFIQWRLKQNPYLTRNQLCELLAQKAPHHTASSWMSHWHQLHDLLDKIVAAAKGEDCAQAEGRESSSVAPKKRPHYRDPSTSDDEDGDENHESSEDELKLPRKRCRPRKFQGGNEMGLANSPFTEADRYAMAEFIADLPEGTQARRLATWGPLAQKYPQRSPAAWYSYYTRHDDELNILAKGIKEERCKVVSRV